MCVFVCVCVVSVAGWVSVIYSVSVCECLWLGCVFVDLCVCVSFSVGVLMTICPILSVYVCLSFCVCVGVREYFLCVCELLRFLVYFQHFTVAWLITSFENESTWHWLWTQTKLPRQLTVRQYSTYILSLKVQGWDDWPYIRINFRAYLMGKKGSRPKVTKFLASD